LIPVLVKSMEMQMFNPNDPYDLGLLFLLLLLAILGCTLLLRLFRRRKRFPWEKRDGLFEPDERSLIKALRLALGGDFCVFPRLQLADLLQPRGNPGKRQTREATEKIAGIPLDFVVCRTRDLEIIGAIEFDRAVSGSRENRSYRSHIEQCLETAAIPLARIPGGTALEPEEIRRVLAEEGFFQRETEWGPAEDWRLGTVEKAPGIQDEEEWRLGESIRPLGPKEKPLGEKDLEIPKCPACGANMARRKATKGHHAGKFFWVCTRYPDCREIMPVSR
jgi:ssDNA-binding Zn-finger/Zn-ribbon topoisomerase 1